jgi:tripartite-type tricarboxylate transporter receptor subunit TctC
MKSALRLLSVVFGLAALPALAADYPSGPVRLIVPFTPGGVTDIAARIFAPAMERVLGQPIVIDNRGGAGGIIGTEQVVRAAPDGQTLLFQASTLPGYPIFTKNVGFDVLEDLAPVSVVADVPFVLSGNREVPFRTFAEFEAYAKANPGKLNYGVTGPGSIMIYFEAIKRARNLDIVQISYKSAAAANQALLANEVQLQFPGIGRLLAQVKEGQAKPLAISGARRAPALPDVPTFGELGINGIDNSWLAVLAPKGTPQPVIAKIHAAIVTASKDPQVVAAMQKAELDIVASTSEAFARQLRDTVAEWKKIADAAGIRPE